MADPADERERERERDDPDAGSGSGSEEEEEEEEGVYAGARDPESGLPHGRGTMTFPVSGMRFEGRYRRGERHGGGTLHFPGGESLRGVWRDGELHGPGVYANADGSATEGTFVDGSLEGAVVERAAGGAAVFRGHYRGSVRHGPGELRPGDGSLTRGTWVDGELDGPAEWFPHEGHFGHRLAGVWRAGELVEGRFVADGEDRAAAGAAALRYDPSTRDRLSSDPLVRDPFEAALVRVAPSLIPNSGEGLFARRALPAGVVCAYYSGVRVPQAEVDGREWEENSNAITLSEEPGDETVVDVPLPWHTEDRYRASLGHKVNHTFDGANSRYDRCWHPRLGDIKCVRTLRDVAAGEEITVEYGYNMRPDGGDERPAWFSAALAAHEAAHGGGEGRAAKRARVE